MCSTDSDMTAILKDCDAMIDVVCGQNAICAIRTTGTIWNYGFNDYVSRELGKWVNIVDLDIGVQHVIALRSDGTVSVVGDVMATRHREAGAWTDIADVACGWDVFMGVRTDGIVVSTDSGSALQDVVAVECDYTSNGNYVLTRANGDMITSNGIQLGISASEAQKWTNVQIPK